MMGNKSSSQKESPWSKRKFEKESESWLVWEKLNTKNDPPGRCGHSTSIYKDEICENIVFSITEN